ncbi:PREDICTED: uncharacterized protein LOC104793341 isoform X2 [Camelina sativa]|uniref:Uncharacterized protein LOC104793341 isoform X1 n=1 Tax=Camelina sativa TaxID=90675 RepID=A0ABM0ZMV6_CAMSA|nr:PREDICTED: uncharacterized protein LOC104793341 isoform X1 [Camelina sativa]XP_010517999.1 PREDICTED: uncharacterized protein LOC104793341 isoform X2 [Camelina sativa]
MDPWSWICELPESPEFVESDSHAVFQLAGDLTRSIKLRAEWDSGSEPESLSLTFKVIVEGFDRLKTSTIWVSDTCLLSSEKPFLPLVLQLLRELISHSPTTRDGARTKSELLEIKPGPVSWVMDSHSPESFSSVFNLILLVRLFWLCVFDAPSEVGSFFFQNLLGPHVNALTCQQAPVLRTFLVSLGVDAELCIVRAASYALSKWMISKEVGLGNLGLKQFSSSLMPSHRSLGFSYATEAHGLWILKGYFPILSMNVTNNSSNQIQNKIVKFPFVEPKEAVLRYALSHQQAEILVQFEYSVKFHENYIKVNARVDDIRIHMSKLGFQNGGVGLENKIADCYSEERYFPSRVRVWLGPEIGSCHVSGLSLGRSTKNEEREVEVTRVLKGNFGKGKVAPRVKARARMSTKRKVKDWKIEQDSEGNAAVFDAVLYDRESGQEVTTVKPNPNQEGLKNVFTKSGGMVFGRDEYGDEVGWRVGREMEGSVLKWRMGGKIWLTYWPNKLNTSFYETRCVEWCDEVDLPLLPTSN